MTSDGPSAILELELELESEREEAPMPTTWDEVTHKVVDNSGAEPITDDTTHFAKFGVPSVALVTASLTGVLGEAWKLDPSKPAVLIAAAVIVAAAVLGVCYAFACDIGTRGAVSVARFHAVAKVLANNAHQLAAKDDDTRRIEEFTAKTKELEAKLAGTIHDTDVAKAELASAHEHDAAEGPPNRTLRALAVALRLYRQGAAMCVRTSRRDGVAAQRSGARRKMVVLLVVALEFAAVAPAAEAAFPGRNGVIAYTAPTGDPERGGGPSEMWTVDPTSGATTQLTDLYWTDGPAWSDDGRTLAFSLFIGRRGYVIAAVPGRRPAAAPWTYEDAEWMTLPAPPTSPGDPFGGALDFEPSWAPGGRRIVYHDAAGSLIVLGSDDSKRVIATGAAGPAWSPDGRLIAFSRCLPSSTGCSLWVVRPNGTGLRQLTDGTMNASAPSWSPDGRRLVFEADGGLWTIPSGHRPDPRRLVESGAGPSWSPDGKQIAFGRGDGVYVVSTDGSNPRKVAETSRPAGQTDWQPKLWPMRVGVS